MRKDSYDYLVNKVYKEYDLIQEISQKFADLTAEAKKILDGIQAKSDLRKESHGVLNGEEPSNHHKVLPPSMKERLFKA